MAMEDDEVNTQTENLDFEEMLNELYIDYVELKNEHAKLKKQLSLANVKCQILQSDNEDLQTESTTKTKCFEKLKAENNALRKSLQDVLSKLRAKKENVTQRKRNTERVNKLYVWIPKTSLTCTQPTHMPNPTLKANETSKFSAVKPPGPILRWVPKCRN